MGGRRACFSAAEGGAREGTRERRHATSTRRRTCTAAGRPCPPAAHNTSGSALHHPRFAKTPGSRQIRPKTAQKTAQKPPTSWYQPSTAAARLGYPHAMFSPTPLVPECPSGQPDAQACAVAAMESSHTSGATWWRALRESCDGVEACVRGAARAWLCAGLGCCVAVPFRCAGWVPSCVSTINWQAPSLCWGPISCQPSPAPLV